MSKLYDVNKSTDKLHREVAEDLVHLDKEQKIIKSDVSVLKEDVDQLTTDVDGIREDVEGIHEQVDINVDNIATNRKNIATNTANIATNRKNIATNGKNIAINTTNIETLNIKKQDLLTAGDGISIKNNVISATGGAGSQFELVSLLTFSNPLELEVNLSTSDTMPENSLLFPSETTVEEHITGGENYITYANSSLTVQQAGTYLYEFEYSFDSFNSVNGNIQLSGCTIINDWDYVTAIDDSISNTSTFDIASLASLNAVNAPYDLSQLIPNIKQQVIGIRTFESKSIVLLFPNIYCLYVAWGGGSLQDFFEITAKFKTYKLK